MQRRRPFGHYAYSVAGQLSSADCLTCQRSATSRLPLSRSLPCSALLLSGRCPPSPPRHTAVLWRAIISAVCSTAIATAASTLSPLLLPVGGTALRWSPITVVTFWHRWRSFVSCPVERRRSLYPPHRSVSSERIKQFYTCCSNV